MNTKYLLGAAIVAVLNCTAVNAQVLSGNAVGGLGGAIGGGSIGGAHDIGVMGQGSAHGAFGRDLDTRSLHRMKDGVDHRVRNRTRDTLDSTRYRTRSTVSGARATAGRVASSAAAKNRDAVGSLAVQGNSTLPLANAHAKEPSLSVPDASLSGALDKDVSTSGSSERLPLATSGSAAAQGNASASKDNGVSANGSAEGSTSATLTN